MDETSSVHTFLLVDTNDHYRFCFTNTNEFVDRTNTSSRQFRQENHALNTVVFQEVDVGAHFGDGTNVDHNHIFDLHKKRH